MVILLLIEGRQCRAINLSNTKLEGLLVDELKRTIGNIGAVSGLA
jgi:hypothetical protein